jgi:hypothetical protein
LFKNHYAHFPQWPESVTQIKRHFNDHVARARKTEPENRGFSRQKNSLAWEAFFLLDNMFVYHTACFERVGDHKGPVRFSDHGESTLPAV